MTPRDAPTVDPVDVARRAFIRVYMTCEKCGGSGEYRQTHGLMKDTLFVCDRCRGTGRTRSEISLAALEKHLSSVRGREDLT